MKYSLPRKKLVVSLNYESTVTALALVYFLDAIYLVTLNETLQTILDIVQLCLLGCIGILFSVQRVSGKNMLLRAVLMVVFTLSTLASGVYPFLKYALVLLAGIHCNAPKLYKKLLKTYAISTLLVLLLGVLGILPSTIVRRGYSTYGFVHSNVIAQYMLAILCCFVMVNYHRFRLRHYLVMITVTYASWWITDSRTSLLAMMLLLLLCVAGKWGTVLFRKRNLFYCLAILLPVLLLLGCYLLAGNYYAGSPLLSLIDIALNGRLTLASNMMDRLPVPLFGQKVDSVLVENAYMVILYHFGLIPTILELLVYMYAIKKSMDQKDYGCLACLLTFAIHGLAESSTFTPFNNVALLSVFCRSTFFNTQNKSKGVSRQNDHNLHTNL